MQQDRHKRQHARGGKGSGRVWGCVGVGSYSLCPSNFRIITPKNVFCGATCPLRTGMVPRRCPRETRASSRDQGAKEEQRAKPEGLPGFLCHHSVILGRRSPPSLHPSLPRGLPHCVSPFISAATRPRLLSASQTRLRALAALRGQGALQHRTDAPRKLREEEEEEEEKRAEERRRRKRREERREGGSIVVKGRSDGVRGQWQRGGGGAERRNAHGCADKRGKVIDYCSSDTHLYRSSGYFSLAFTFR